MQAKFVALLAAVAIAALSVASAQSNPCNGLSKSACAQNSSCVWCLSGAIPSACYSIDQSKKLPPGVFDCSSPSELEMFREALLKGGWSNCGASSDHLSGVNVQLTPNPPKKGQQLTVAITGTLNEALTSGSVSLEVQFSGITVEKKTSALCSFPDVTCPVAKGAFKLSLVEQIPSSIPSGDYTFKGHVYDQNHQEVLCIKADFKL